MFIKQWGVFHKLSTNFKFNVLHNGILFICIEFHVGKNNVFFFSISFSKKCIMNGQGVAFSTIYLRKLDYNSTFRRPYSWTFEKFRILFVHPDTSILGVLIWLFAGICQWDYRRKQLLCVRHLHVHRAFLAQVRCPICSLCPCWPQSHFSSFLRLVHLPSLCKPKS